MKVDQSRTAAKEGAEDRRRSAIARAHPTQTTVA